MVLFASKWSLSWSMYSETQKEDTTVYNKDQNKIQIHPGQLDQKKESQSKENAQLV